MDSETLNVVAENEKRKKKGLNILGYVVPWWIVVLVILVALYFSYEQGYLDGIINDSILPSRTKEIELKGPIVPALLSAESAPAGVKALFNTSRYY